MQGWGGKCFLRDQGKMCYKSAEGWGQWLTGEECVMGGDKDSVAGA